MAAAWPAYGDSCWSHKEGGVFNERPTFAPDSQKKHSNPNDALNELNRIEGSKRASGNKSYGQAEEKLQRLKSNKYHVQ